MADYPINYNILAEDLPKEKRDGPFTQEQAEWMFESLVKMCNEYDSAMETIELIQKDNYVPDASTLNAFEQKNREAIWELENTINQDGENVCEGCWHCHFPGIRWPASPDGYQDLSYVDRCDYCERYESDEEAAKFLAAKFNVRWGYADRVQIPKVIRWEPPQDDNNSYAGWSCFIERTERDG